MIGFTIFLIAQGMTNISHIFKVSELVIRFCSNIFSSSTSYFDDIVDKVSPDITV
ncbi:MAG: hypothetical protein P1U46_04405 [Patescibacteria group bacterium]|nr:hypothetical protein [Patescibacteria group bacterium]